MNKELQQALIQALAYKLADILYAMVNAEDGGCDAYGIYEEGMIEKRDVAVELFLRLKEDPKTWIDQVAGCPEELKPALDWTLHDFQVHLHGEYEDLEETFHTDWDGYDHDNGE